MATGSCMDTGNRGKATAKNIPLLMPLHCQCSAVLLFEFVPFPAPGVLGQLALLRYLVHGVVFRRNHTALPQTWRIPVTLVDQTQLAVSCQKAVVFLRTGDGRKVSRDLNTLFKYLLFR